MRVFLRPKIRISATAPPALLRRKNIDGKKKPEFLDGNCFVRRRFFGASFRENPGARTAENVRAIVRELRFSGCPNSCTSHQSGRFGFNGFKKMLDGKMTEGFVLWERPADVPAMGADTGRFVPAAELPDAVVRLVRDALLR